MYNKSSLSEREPKKIFKNHPLPTRRFERASIFLSVVFLKE